MGLSPDIEFTEVSHGRGLLLDNLKSEFFSFTAMRC